MPKHTFLVAVSVDGSSREHAEARLMAMMPVADDVIEQWWVAEDDRRDGSDGGSAVLCTAGRQSQANAILDAAGLTGEPDYDEFHRTNRALRRARRVSFAEGQRLRLTGRLSFAPALSVGLEGTILLSDDLGNCYVRWDNDVQTIIFDDDPVEVLP